MTKQLSAISPVAAMLVHALERAVQLYETRISSVEDYDAKLTEDGVRLATALDRLRKVSDELASQEKVDLSEQDDARTRELLTRLETEIEATIARRMAAFADSIPTQCAQCGAQLSELAVAQKPASTGKK